MADTRPAVRRLVQSRPRTAASSLLSGAGAADEELFIKSFEQVPRMEIFCSKDLNLKLSDILHTLNDTSGDWEKRVEHLKRIRSVMLVRATDWGLEDFVHRFKDLELALISCLKDLRSKVVFEACVTIAFLCQRLGLRMDRFCEGLMPVLFSLIPNSAKIMSTSAFVCIRFVIQYTHAPRLIPVICNHMSSKSKEIRKACCEFLDQLMHTWPTQSLEKYMPTLQKSVMQGISDADVDARVFARRAFWGFAEHFKDQADGMIHSLDPHKQKVLLGEVPGTLSASNSTNSLLGSTAGPTLTANGRSTSGRHFVPSSRPARPSVSTSNSVENLHRPWSAMAANRGLAANRSRIPVFSPKESIMDRSMPSPLRYGSAIDVGAARRARARAVIASAMAHPNPPTSSNFPLSRVGLARRIESPAVATGVVSSPDRPSRSNGNGRVSQSQPNSRSASPSSWLHRYEHDRTYRSSKKSSIPQATSRDPSPTRICHVTERVRRVSDTVDARFDLEKRLTASTMEPRRSSESEARHDSSLEINKFIPIALSKESNQTLSTPLQKPQPRSTTSDPQPSLLDSGDHCLDVLRPLIAELPSNQAAIKMFTKLVEQQPNSVVSQMMPEMMPALVQAYDSPEIAVRKAAVFAMVAIHNSVGADAMKPFLSNLNNSKMKLLNLYIERSKSEAPPQTDSASSQQPAAASKPTNGFSSPANKH